MEIFISYRRDDSSAATGRIDDHLRSAFGEGSVVRDVDSIPLGADWMSFIDHAVSRCDVLLAIVGPDWLTPRLQEADDPVRVEIESALKREIPTIPVLVDGATLPKLQDLPGALQGLVRRNGVAIDSGQRFKPDIARLVKGLMDLAAVKQASPVIAAVTPVTADSPTSNALDYFGDVHVPQESASGVSAAKDGWRALASRSPRTVTVAGAIAIALLTICIERAVRLLVGEKPTYSYVGPGTIPNVARVVNAMRNDFKACYQRQRALDPGASGKIQLTMTVGKEGTVTDVMTKGASSLPLVEDCIRARAREAKFEAPANGTATIVLPVDFR